MDPSACDFIAAGVTRARLSINTCSEKLHSHSISLWEFRFNTWCCALIHGLCLF